MKKILVISNTAFSIKKFRFHYLHKLSKKFKIHIRTPDKIQNLEKKKYYI